MHNIYHFTYPKNVNKKQVQKELDELAAHEDWQEGCTGLFRDIRWIDSKIYKSRDEAEEAIKRMDSGCYDQLAVLFEYRHDPTDAKVTAIKDRVRATYDEFNKRDKVLYSRTVSSTLISCKNCGSKLARVRLKTNSCPVCGTELRPEHMLKSVEVAKERWRKANRDLNEYIQKHGKSEVKWLVKIEFHT